MNLSDAIKYRIIELCNEKNLNVNQLSNKSGLNPATVRSILRKKNCKSFLVF